MVNLPQIIKADNYIVEGRSWRYCDQYTDSLFRITVKGDSLFDGKQCKKLEYSDSKETKLAGFAYETKDNRIFIYNLLDLERCDFMHEGWLETNNFGLAVGDSISFRTRLGYDGIDKIDYIDTIIVNNKIYKRWNMKRTLRHKGRIINQDKKVTRAIVDGIGNAYYSYTGNTKYYNHSAGIYSQYEENYVGIHMHVLLSVYDGDKCIFNADDFIKEAATKTDNPQTLVEGRSWRYEKYSISDAGEKRTEEFSITVGTDTIFENRWCKKLVYSDENGTSLAGIAYETEDGKVNIYNMLQLDNGVFLHKGWMCTNDINTGRLGDKVSYIDGFEETPYIIGGIDSIDVKGTIRMRWHIVGENTDNNTIFTIVEGIGNSKYGIYAFCSLEPDSYPQYSFVSCYQGNECIFEESDFKLPSIDKQNGNTFLVEGRSWKYKQTFYDKDLQEYFEKDFVLSINGETTFKNIVCKKIYYKEGGQSSLYGYAYQDGTKVYFYFLKDIENFCSPSTDWELIFDFSKKEKEIFCGSFPSFLADIDTIEVKGKTYQRYWIGPKHDGKIIKLYPIVYSIGGLRGLHNNDFEGKNDYLSYSCVSIYDNDKCIFERDDFFAEPLSDNSYIATGRRWDYVYYSYLYVYNNYTGKKVDVFTKQQPYSLIIGEDTIVAGRSCKKLYHRIKNTNYIISASKYVNDTLYVPDEKMILHGYIHETDDSVSFYIEQEIEGVSSPSGVLVPATGVWTKMYDYSAPTGTYCEWLDKVGKQGYYVLGKEKIEIRNKTYNCHLLYAKDAAFPNGTYPIIQGIGCGGLYYQTSSINEKFVAAYDGEECILEYGDWEKLLEKYIYKYAAVIDNFWELIDKQKDITHLWIWNDKSYWSESQCKKFKETYLPKLEYINFYNADIDTLAENFLNTTLPAENTTKKYIVLPRKLRHVKDNALCIYPNITTYEVTGVYPTLGKNVYSKKGNTSNHIFVVPSKDNEHLTLHTIDPTGGSSGPERGPIKRVTMVEPDSTIYGSFVMSKDGDTLYYVNTSNGKGYAKADSIKIIGSNAMENKMLEDVFNIPESVDSIGDRAFNGLQIVQTRSIAPEYYMSCYSITPPLIGCEVFDESSLITGEQLFYVNRESIKVYKNTWGWDKLYYGDLDEVSGIKEVITQKPNSKYYYDLFGHKVLNPSKGIYIKDGKKVIVK